MLMLPLLLLLLLLMMLLLLLPPPPPPPLLLLLPSLNAASREARARIDLCRLLQPNLQATAR